MFVVFYRTVVLYILVIAVLRFTGKRQIGELQASELVTALLISNIAAIPIENTDKSLIFGIIPIVLISCLEIFLSFICIKSVAIRTLIAGHARPVIKDGIIDQYQMKQLRLSIDDLTEQLRSNGVFNIDEVLYAVIETNGKLSVLLKYENRPSTNKDNQIKLRECENPSVVVISDGKISTEGLNFCNLTESWLYEKLKAMKLTKKDIYIMTANCDGDIYVAKKEI